VIVGQLGERRGDFGVLDLVSVLGGVAFFR
jgi:hypothetical protein